MQVKGQGHCFEVNSQRWPTMSLVDCVREGISELFATCLCLYVTHFYITVNKDLRGSILRVATTVCQVFISATYLQLFEEFCSNVAKMFAILRGCVELNLRRVVSWSLRVRYCKHNILCPIHFSNSWWGFEINWCHIEVMCRAQLSVRSVTVILQRSQVMCTIFCIKFVTSYLLNRSTAVDINWHLMVTTPKHKFQLCEVENVHIGLEEWIHLYEGHHIGLGEGRHLRGY